MDKKFNFQKLISGIGIAAIALVGSLIGAPASNAAASMTISDSTWDANLASPAVNLTVSNISTASQIDKIYLDVLTSDGADTGWDTPVNCPDYLNRTTTWSNCAIQSAANNGTALANTWTVNDYAGDARIQLTGAGQDAFTSSGDFTVSLNVGAFTSGGLNGTYKVKLTFVDCGSGCGEVDSASANITISGGSPAYTITFDPNGGVAGTVTSRTQTSTNGSIQLLSNGAYGAPTRTGCTLQGWMATTSSNSWYINSRVPSSDETLYAKWSGSGCSGSVTPQSSAQVVRLPEWQNKAINSITKVIDQSGVKLIGGKIKLDGVTASDLKKVTLNGKEISVDSLNPEAPVLNIPAGAGTGDLVFTLANGGTWTFQNAVRYVEPIKAGKPMKLFNFDNGSTTVNSYQVAQIAAQTADLMRGSTVECFGYVAKKNANTVARATAQAEAICAEALKINPALKKVITIGVDEIMALQPNRIRVFG